MTKQLITIAIDGPVAAGKSTVAHALSKRLGIAYFNTGRMYRLLAFKALQKNIAFDDASHLTMFIDKNETELKDVFSHSDTGYEYLTDPAVAYGASCVGLIAQVRTKLVCLQQEVLLKRSAVVEGRDVAKRVLPSATLKVYLTATVAVRAKRRMAQYRARGATISESQVKEELQMRDIQDSNRNIDPLLPTNSMHTIDTTKLSIEQTVDRIINLLN